MGAPRNDAKREQIYTAAISLFSANGFKATTYSDIAKACEVSKSIVQHYFPKKEIIVEQFFDRHMEKLFEHCGSMAENDPLKVFYSMGLLHFDFILNDEEMRRFNEDIVASRELTSVIIERELRWALRYLSSQNDEELSGVITAALGGAYELIFQSKKNNRKLDPCTVERIAFSPLAFFFGKSQSQIAEIIETSSATLPTSD